ncbi:putative ribosomally synthesized peptide with nif11-like leader [Azomonas agilis]|uniref:Putative ribosomally synthesized peptide with nif11-like leader n=1 Tax=Azomonas agilis TaxID=116849 RepID=A0A562IYZ9_9GAMM|nr:Nif11-like leader peptide family natural product precursor [Azomonas agilis]TWH76148.1 putative ribosomally synthesized peptide with nif11-like leader [Azomonas agilis]
MSVESAKTYITRMRNDEDFRRIINAASEDEAASWALIKEHGYDFTMQDFQLARDEIYKEYGITPM